MLFSLNFPANLSLSVTSDRRDKAQLNYELTFAGEREKGMQGETGISRKHLAMSVVAKCAIY